MENAADALKIAFAVLVFIIAITIIFLMVSKVRSTADVVLYYSDNTNYYDYYDYNEEGLKDEMGNRIVTVSDIVSTLYRYYKESVAVTIIIGSDTYCFDIGNESLMEDETKQSIATIEGKERNLSKFINNILMSYKNTTFSEEFSEIHTSGIYSTGSDGTQITLSSGAKKVYVIYTQITT